MKPWRNGMSALRRRLLWQGMFTGIKRKTQGWREGAFGKGDHLLQHSEVSERRPGRARTKDTEEWMELGTSQGVN